MTCLISVPWPLSLQPFWPLAVAAVPEPACATLPAATAASASAITTAPARFGPCVLEGSVAAVVARLELGDRVAGRDRHDLEQVGDPRFLLGVVAVVGTRVGDCPLQLLADRVRWIGEEPLAGRLA